MGRVGDCATIPRAAVSIDIAPSKYSSRMMILVVQSVVAEQPVDAHPIHVDSPCVQEIPQSSRGYERGLALMRINKASRLSLTCTGIDSGWRDRHVRVGARGEPGIAGTRSRKDRRRFCRIVR